VPSGIFVWNLNGGEKMKIATRRLTVTGMLGAISIILGLTPLGFIPVGPTKATIMHIPVIIGSIVEGPIVGLMIGLIFGSFSMFQAYAMPTSPVQVVFLDPMVAVVPRLLIAITSYYTYWGLKKFTMTNRIASRGMLIPSMGAAAVGTLTNTVGVLGMIYIRHAAKYAELLGIEQSTVGNFIIYGVAIPNGVPEIIVAIIVVTAVVQALSKLTKKAF